MTIESAVPDGATRLDGFGPNVSSILDSSASQATAEVTPRAKNEATSRPIDEATEWALSARTGDPVAAAAFVRATQAEVWRFVASLVDAGAADDLTQETYLRAFRALPAFEGRASARTWLFGIARRTCADHIRSAVRRRRLLTRAAALDIVEPYGEDLSGSVSAMELLRRLSTAQREAFVLTQVLGLSYEEAAQSLDVPIGTIRSRVARARAELVAAVAQTWAV